MWYTVFCLVSHADGCVSLRVDPVAYVRADDDEVALEAFAQVAGTEAEFFYWLQQCPYPPACCTDMWHSICPGHKFGGQYSARDAELLYCYHHYRLMRERGHVR